MRNKEFIFGIFYMSILPPTTGKDLKTITFIARSQKRYKKELLLPYADSLE